mmetsp:Transcript_47319/g.133472  ORF Transcript_47319/g.133472 Transcript_47319/m.133472 type:complete len:320 (-) Transcript_47319:57-1016(-)
MGRKSKAVSGGGGGDAGNAGGGGQQAPAPAPLAPSVVSPPAGLPNGLNQAPGPGGGMPNMPGMQGTAPGGGMQNLQGMQALMANPLLMAANPMLAMSMMNNALLQGARPRPPPPPQQDNAHPMIDPDVQELCDHFHIEDRHLQRLNEIMKNRQDTFEGDMLKLWEKLEDAREPAGLLVVKMREMEEGTFIGKQKADKELVNLSKKYNLDNTAESRLADIIARFEEPKKKEMYEELEKHFEVSNRPSAMAMMLLRKLSEGQPLGRPGPAAPGSYLDRKMRERQDGKDSHGDRDRDRRRSRDRGRSRDRDRRKSRSRSRRR